MTSPEQQRRPGLGGRKTALICAGLLMIFSICSFSAVLTKNATIDEPTHAMSGWLELRTGDFRLELVNPPLWKCWAAIGNLFASPRIRRDSPVWNDLTWEPVEELAWTCRTLYDTPGYDGEAFVNRSRAMMLLLGVGLGVVIAVWSYRLAGPVAAITATLFFSFDPNFIAHAPLVKSDVALALVMTALAWSVWSLGRHATVGKIILIGLLCGAAVGAKFSGVIVGPILAVMLLFRAMSRRPWQMGSREISTRIGRLLAAISIGVGAAVVCLFVTWGCYGFRYRPAPSPSVRIIMPAIFDRTAFIETTVEAGHRATDGELAHHPMSVPTRFVKFADEHHLLPQAFLGGFLYQRDCTLIWPSFLDGERYGDGRWAYFPLAMLYKTPIATLAVFLISALLAIAVVAQKIRTPAEPGANGQDAWTVACCLIPFVIFAIAAMQTRLNIGMRSVLPVYPFLYIGVGCAAAWAHARRPKLFRVGLPLLAVILMTETLSVWPDYIAYFNVAVGGEKGGFNHLAGSNLDWGQDIKSLVAWQRGQPPTSLFFDYDGPIDPKFFQLQYHPLWFDPSGRPASDVPMTRGILAIRAEHLQGISIKPATVPFYNWLQGQRPIAVIHGTIYLYELPPSSDHSGSIRPVK